MSDIQPPSRCSTGRHEDEDCTYDYRYTHASGARSWFCTKHQQWNYVHPIAIEYHYFDQTTAKFEIK